MPIIKGQWQFESIAMRTRYLRQITKQVTLVVQRYAAGIVEVKLVPLTAFDDEKLFFHGSECLSLSIGQSETDFKVMQDVLRSVVV